MRSPFVKSVFENFIDYKDDKIRPLCIFLPKMSTYIRDFDETEYMSFLIKDDKLFKKYNEICEKVQNSIEKEFNSKPIYNEKYLKAKIKSCNEKINTNFHNSKIPRESSQLFVYQ